MRNFLKHPPTSTERKAAIRQIISEEGAISASPPVAFQILTLSRQSKYSNHDLVRLIEVDPELSAQILRLVNSVERRGSGVGSLDEATMRLGITEISNLAMSLTMGRLIASRQTSYCPNPQAFWHHCVQCALACRYLRPICRGVYCEPDLVFTAGLLHDIGKVVINGAPPEAVDVIVGVMREEGISGSDAELAVLGADHAEIGGEILDRWNLPVQLTTAVRLHHAPDVDQGGLAMLVHVGNCCAKVHAGSRGWQDFQQLLKPQALERLGLSRWEIEECWGEVLQSMDEIERFVGC